jgi:hypothetical protein
MLQGMQDAGFHTSVYSRFPDVHESSLAFLALSNFGRFAAVSEPIPSREQLAAVLLWLSRFGYVYIPSEILEERYDGMIGAFRGGTWFRRFFDFI